MAANVLLHLGVNMLKLRVAVRMVRPLFRLPVGLQAVFHFMQQFRDYRVAHSMSHLLQLFGQLTHALTGPP